MSSFTMQLKHKQSGEYHNIFAIDDWFGRHLYGFRLPDGTILDEVEMEQLYHPREI